MNFGNLVTQLKEIVNQKSLEIFACISLMRFSFVLLTDLLAKFSNSVVDLFKPQILNIDIC